MLVNNNIIEMSEILLGNIYTFRRNCYFITRHILPIFFLNKAWNQRQHVKMNIYCNRLRERFR